MNRLFPINTRERNQIRGSRVSNDVIRFLIIVALAVTAIKAQPKTSAPEPVYKFYSTVFGTSVVKPGGLTGYVFALPPDTERLPELERRNAIARIYTSVLNVPVQDFSVGFPGVPERFEWFAIDYRGNIWIVKPGNYRFVLSSDDGSVLFIDDHLVIDNDGIHSALAKKGSVRLSAGEHSIRVVYFQGPRFQVQLQLEVAGPKQKLHLFDTDDFGPSPKP